MTSTFESKRRARNLLTGSGVVTVFLIGILGLQEERLLTWRPVDATVVSRSVNTHQGSRGSYTDAVVTYRYEVSGISYSSNQFYPLTWAGGTYDEVSQETQKYAPGFSTVAYVDPDNPARAFLVHESHNRATLIEFIAAFGCMALVSGWRLRRLNNLYDSQWL